MFFVFGTGIIVDANTHKEEINIKSLIISQNDSYSNNLDNNTGETICRLAVEETILILYALADYSLQELANLESKMLIKCFDLLI